ncbi:MAG: RNA 2',3'-cyclic phosphodiesterase [Anaerolineales bacterium]|nr:RNA 2',3'-cyclic phosphodiesterase [Anaerolineae bacterium]PWB52391.1 MAG: RNA 2',3'-cyclic phosphodiesterase [Anaerolineales bacterium]
MAGVIRAFIAIDLSTDIQYRLDEVMVNFKSLLPHSAVRWVPSANIHLTLKFLGDVSLSNLTILTDMLQTEISGHHQFDISVGGAGAFPNNRQPRVIWVGVEAPAELAAIQNGIETTTSRLGYAREDRAFSPHLTLGRVSRNATSQDAKMIAKVLETTRVGFLGATCVEKVHLYRSDLQPSGAVYTHIFSASLIK